MREIKFRAWWKDTKRFLDCDEWYMTCSWAKYLHYAVMPYKDDNFIIEQFTGLKDKNGKEIYEGDIVKFRERAYEVEFDKYGQFIIENKNYHWLENLYSFRKVDIWCSDGILVEVIGNIHEHPELLETKNEIWG